MTAATVKTTSAAKVHTRYFIVKANLQINVSDLKNNDSIFSFNAKSVRAIA
ncbi:ORF205 [Saltwater crocodilepox virus]|nr:hypothetical protein [Saltwater crocodilepox virus]AVD69539.1 hypothetical protein [Saltwater crocodilepox virus]QGT46642.1 ORF205 [Saltwater crocodilepox virus]QGT46860.1 ORF205 [Saltwater crocodilepox virus]QGT47074.1 ORF205 [Saltwater crocodilepox virus]